MAAMLLPVYTAPVTSACVRGIGTGVASGRHMACCSSGEPSVQELCVAVQPREAASLTMTYMLT